MAARFGARLISTQSFNITTQAGMKIIPHCSIFLKEANRVWHMVRAGRIIPIGRHLIQITCAKSILECCAEALRE